MSLSYVAQATAAANSTTVSPAVPTGTTNGDLILAFVAVSNTDTVSAPAGWTPVAQHTGANLRAYLWRRVASSEPASYTFTANTSGNLRATLVTYRGQHVTTPVPTNGATDGNSNTPTAPSIAPTESARLVCFYAQRNSTATLTVAGALTSRFSHTTVLPQAMGDQAVAAGSTGTRAGSSTQSAAWIGVSIAIVAAPDPPPAALRRRPLRYGLFRRHGGSG